MENIYFAMENVKRYTDPKDYRNLILVNKEFYGVFKTMEHVVKLNKLLFKGGWFSIYTHQVIPDMNFLDTLDCLIYSLEKQSKKYHLFHKVNGIIASKIKRSPTLKGINLLGY